MNSEYVKLQDVAIYEAELKGFNWGYENGSLEAFRYGHHRRYQLECAATFSSEHKALWDQLAK